MKDNDEVGWKLSCSAVSQSLSLYYFLLLKVRKKRTRRFEFMQTRSETTMMETQGASTRKSFVSVFATTRQSAVSKLGGSLWLVISGARTFDVNVTFRMDPLE